MRRLISALIVATLILMTVALLLSCKDSSTGKAKKNVYLDDLDREVTIEKTPERIISVSPACTEILFALGLGDKVVGVTQYCDYPEEAQSKPKIGTFTTPNLEAIVASNPDLVLVTGGVQRELISRMEEMGLTLFAVNAPTFERTVEDIRKIGEITGTSQRAEEIARDMESRAARIESEVRRRRESGDKPPRVFYEIFYENNVWTAGSGSVISNLIALAGGINIADAETNDYYEFSVERLISENPEIYFVGSGSMSNPGDITKRPGWDRVSAVRNGKVYVINEDLVYRTGPRLIEGLEVIFEYMYR